MKTAEVWLDWCQTQDDVNWVVYMEYPNVPPNPFPITSPLHQAFNNACDKEHNALINGQNHEELSPTGQP